jgi:hypothetical protein
MNKKCITMSVTFETLLDQVENLLAENPENPPRPDLSLPDDYEDDNPYRWMTLSDNGIKGKGWHAKVDIPAGTVLICAKPIVMVMDWMDPSEQEGFQRDNDEEIAFEDEVAGLSKLNELLLLEILKSIAKDPSLWTDQLSELFPRTDDDLEALDSWVCTDDAVFMQFENLLNDIRTTELTEEEVKEISKRLPLVVRYNVLSAETSPELMVHPSPKGYAALSGTALYHLPSFLNHDSRPNASRYAVGDVLWIVANQDIHMGEEVCISYLEHEVLCEPPPIRTLMLNMDFAEPQQEGDEDELDDEGPDMPVVDVEVQNELMQMEPMERLQAINNLTRQALGEAVAEEEDEMEGAPWFECDVQNLRILKALTLDGLGKVSEALPIWEECVLFTESKLPPNDEASVVMRVQAALCALQSGERGKAQQHAVKALATHSILFGGGIQRFRRRYEREFQLALRPTLTTAGPDDLWPLPSGE